MTDQPPNSARSSFQVALNKLRGNKPTVPTPTEEEIHEENIIRALNGSRQLRMDLAHMTERALSAEQELAEKTRIFENKLRDMRQDLEGVIIGLRQENQMLRGTLATTTAKMENFQQWGLELTTKSNDLEMYFIAEMGRVADAANQNANTLINHVNQACSSMKKFVDDLNNRRNVAEFAPKLPKPKGEKDEADLLSKENLADLEAQIRAPESPREQASPPPADDGHPIPEFLTTPKHDQASS